MTSIWGEYDPATASGPPRDDPQWCGSYEGGEPDDGREMTCAQIREYIRIYWAKGAKAARDYYRRVASS